MKFLKDMFEYFESILKSGAEFVAKLAEVVTGGVTGMVNAATTGIANMFASLANIFSGSEEDAPQPNSSTAVPPAAASDLNSTAANASTTANASAKSANNSVFKASVCRPC